MKKPPTKEVKRSLAEMLRSEFAAEIVSLQCRIAHYKCGNTAMADKYSTEIRHIERLLKVVNLFIMEK